MSKPKMLSREEILRADDLTRERLEVPEWGGALTVRAMTGAERDAFESAILTRRGQTFDVNMRNVRAKLAAWTVVDEAGARLFTEADVEQLSQKSAAALQRVFDVASRLSGLSRADVEELAKNSTAGQNGDSGSVSA
jgi:hypothetical protein